MVESISVDDVWSFERIAQMRRMTDVLPAVLLQFKALGPDDLVPVQFQFSHRRTDLIATTCVVVPTSESDADEDDEIQWDLLGKAAHLGDRRSDEVDQGVTNFRNSDLANQVHEQQSEETYETQVVQPQNLNGDQTNLENVTPNLNISNSDQNTLEGFVSNVNLNDDYPRSSIHGQNMRAAAPRSGTPAIVSDSSLPDSGLQSSPNSSRDVNVMSANKQELLNRLFVQRLEKQEQLLAYLRGSSSTPESSDVRYRRHGRSHNSVSKRNKPPDKPLSNSRRHHRHKVAWDDSLSDNEGFNLKSKKSVVSTSSKHVKR